MLKILRWPLKHWKLSIAFVVGAFTAMFLIGFTHMSFEMTGTNEFCGRCHEMQPRVETWRMSRHHSNDKGIIADCVDCHLPASGAYYYIYKSWSGWRDLWVHYVGDPEKVDWQAKRFHKEQYVFEGGCMSCHKDLTPPGLPRGGFLAHREWMNGRTNKKCWDCHSDLVHHGTPVIFAKNDQ